VHVALVADVERALRADQLMLLPELRELVLLLDDGGSDEKALESATAAFGAFVDERESAGCSVKIYSQDLSRLAESESGEPPVNQTEQRNRFLRVPSEGCLISKKTSEIMRKMILGQRRSITYSSSRFHLLELC
jgi:hypothetical protein